jgi:predicted nucleotidyltransferase
MSAPAKSAVVDDLVTGLRAALGDQLVGIYLYGSAVVGGFDNDISDLDLVAVTTVDASQLDLANVGRVHDDIVRLHPMWKDRIEVVYVGESTLRSLTEGGPVAVISPGEPLHLTDGADLWVQNWYLARTTSIALDGPARESIFPTISLDEFITAIGRYAAEVKGRNLSSMIAGGRAYTVLTMCRALATVSTGRPCSKQEGAAWMRGRHPEWDFLVEAALACRASGRGFDDPETIAEAESLVRAIANEIALIVRAPPRHENLSAEMAIDQAHRVVMLVREVLADAVIGAYLHGSAAFGGLQATSDIDLLVVARRPTTRPEKHALIERLLPMSGRGDPTGRSRSVELTIVVAGDVRPWRYPSSLDFQYGDWWRREFERGDVTPWESPNPDLTLQLEMAHQADHPLFGPPPAEVLDPIPPADVRRAMLDGIPALLSDLDGDERNVVLTIARIWMSLATGMIRSKDAAADWALPLLPPEHRPVLAHARAIYRGQAAEEWGDLLARVRPLVDHVIGEIERLDQGY